MTIINKNINDLIPYANNPRKNGAAVDKVAASIKEFGFKVPIIIGTDNVIVTGHTRLLAAQKLGLETVPCVIADDLTPTRIKDFRIADNKTAEFSEWDDDMLKVELADYLKSLDGETRVIMEYTGRYYQPIARYLHETGIFVTAVHAKLIHDYGNNSIRKVKTDKADAVKIANYGLSNWTSLKRYTPEDDTRLLLKTCNRQYNQYMKLKIALKNNLIALLDRTFPGANTFFTSPARADGHEKRVNFAAKFWHCEHVRKLTKAQFTDRYNKWCSKSGYIGKSSKAEEIYEAACRQVPMLPCNELTKQLIEQVVAQISSLASTLVYFLC